MAQHQQQLTREQLQQKVKELEETLSVYKRQGNFVYFARAKTEAEMQARIERLHQSLEKLDIEREGVVLHFTKSDVGPILHSIEQAIMDADVTKLNVAMGKLNYSFSTLPASNSDTRGATREAYKKILLLFVNTRLPRCGLTALGLCTFSAYNAQQAYLAQTEDKQKFERLLAFFSMEHHLLAYGADANSIVNDIGAERAFDHLTFRNRFPQLLADKVACPHALVCIRTYLRYRFSPSAYAHHWKVPEADAEKRTAAEYAVWKFAQVLLHEMRHLGRSIPDDITAPTTSPVLRFCGERGSFKRKAVEPPAPDPPAPTTASTSSSSRPKRQRKK